MQRLPAVNPGDTTKYPTGIGTFDVGAADEGSKILFYNESPINLDLDFLNGSTDVLHAWEANYWTLDADTKQIEWEIDADSLNVTTPPVSAVFMTLYGPQEKLSGTFPMALIRQASVGNVGGIPTTNTNQVINDGNTLQEVIEATLLGHSSSDVIVNNDGSYTLTGAGLLAAAGVLTHILGTLTVDQLITASGGLLAWGEGINTNPNASIALAVATGNDTHKGIVAFGNSPTQSGNLLECQNSAFSTLFKISASGLATFAQNIVANGGMNINTIRDDVNGNPALDLSNGDGSINFPQMLIPNVAGIVNNGSVGGTLTALFPIWGSALKIALFIFANWNSTGTPTFNFPSTMIRSAFFITDLGSAYTFAFQLNGVNVTGDIISALGTTSAAGTSATATTVHSNSYGGCQSSHNQLLSGSSSGAARNGIILVVGA